MYHHQEFIIASCNVLISCVFWVNFLYIQINRHTAHVFMGDTDVHCFPSFLSFLYLTYAYTQDASYLKIAWIVHYMLHLEILSSNGSDSHDYYFTKLLVSILASIFYLYFIFRLTTTTPSSIRLFFLCVCVLFIFYFIFYFTKLYVNIKRRFFIIFIIMYNIIYFIPLIFGSCYYNIYINNVGASTKFIRELDE